MKSRPLLIRYFLVALATLFPLLGLAGESSADTSTGELAPNSHWIISPDNYDSFIETGNIVAIYPGISIDEDRFFIYILGSHCTNEFPFELSKITLRQMQKDFCENDLSSELASTVNQRALLLVTGKITDKNSSFQLQVADTIKLEWLRRAISENRSTFPGQTLALIEAILDKDISVSIAGNDLRLNNGKQSIIFNRNPFPDPTTPTDLTYMIGLSNGLYFRCFIREFSKMSEFDAKTGIFGISKTSMNLEYRRSMLFREGELAGSSPNLRDKLKELQKQLQPHLSKAEKKYVEAEAFFKSKLHCNL